MNNTQGPIYWISVMVLISLLLFKGVASAAMWCCGPAGQDHSAHHQTTMPVHQMADHMHHSADESSSGQQDMSSCPGCASGCTTTALMLSHLDSICDSIQTERILVSVALKIPLTGSGLERPPRFIS